MNSIKIMNILLLSVALAFTVCGDDEDDNESMKTGYSAGDKKTYTADGISFTMAYVPGGLMFPIHLNDEDTATVTNAYWISATEVTYELWDKVYDWATTDMGGGKRADGGDLYTFANTGQQGDNGSRGALHPVTMVNCRDCIAWCNALTEWYNAKRGTSYECVYTYSNTIIRDSRDTNYMACDGAVASSTAKGFRLITNNEWELAARYRDGTHWTYGDHVSGDDSGACYDDGSILGELGMSTVFGNYAVYSDNSGASTAEVMSKTANALGLFDMSGNVREWCFTWINGSYRVVRDGSWNDLSYSLRVGYWYNAAFPDYEFSITGFRFVRTQ